MDMQKLRNLLKGTLEADVRKKAEDELSQIRKIAGFGPSLLRLVMSEELSMAERQAGVIYLKNLIMQSWQPVTEKISPATDEDVFEVHAQDKELIRNSIVDAVVLSPDMIKCQLCVCTLTIIKFDFPHNFGSFVQKINDYLNNPDTNLWMGTLMCLYQLTKHYEYKKLSERKPQLETMRTFLPMLYERLVHLQNVQTDHNMLLQKMILKIFYAFTQLYFPHEVITRPILTQWLECLRQILTRNPVPEGTEIPEDDDDKQNMPGWKLNKWALTIINRIFERYGCPSTVNSENKTFANWYMKTFTQGILEVLLKILDTYRNGHYVSSRVLHHALTYLEQGLGQALFWKLLAPHMEEILKHIVFPLMCHSDSDQELWDNDPVEFIRRKNDLYEDLVCPVSAATGLLSTCVRKRKSMMDKVMGIVTAALHATENKEINMDGAFHMMGSLGSILCKKEQYKSEMESMLVQYVFPQFQSPHGYLRARSFWLLQYYADIKWTPNVNPGMIAPNLAHAVNSCINALLNETALPIRVEAAQSISVYISTQEKTEEMLVPQMANIVKELVLLIQHTESDELTNVMAKFVTTYSSHLTPIAVDIARQLAITFQQVLCSDNGNDEKAITAMSLLNTVEVLLSAMEDSADIVKQIEPIVLELVVLIMDKGIMEFYEEALSMVYNLTSSNITPDLWKCFDLLLNLFKTDGFDYFIEMLPCLHNFVAIDTNAFMAVESRLPAMCQMCQVVLNGSEEEDVETHAAKLLEVIVLTCPLNSIVLTDIITLVVNRLVDTNKAVKTTELRIMLLQVIIAGLYVNKELILSMLNSPLPTQNGTVLELFIKQWIEDIDCFLGLHDRKLCVLGLCTLLQLGPDRVPALQAHYGEILPAILTLFQGLKRAYVARAAEESQESDDDDDIDSSDFEDDVLESDEDELDENEGLFDNGFEDIENRIRNAKNAPFPISITEDAAESSDADDEDYDDLLSQIDETDLEGFSTPLDKEDCDIDEYWIFKTIMQNLQGSAWFNALTEKLTSEQKTEMQEVATLADQRKAASESRKIQQSGGYNFQQVNVPSSFNFGGSFAG